MPKMASECTILHLGNNKNYGGDAPRPPLQQHAPMAHEIDFLKFSAPRAILQSHPWYIHVMINLRSFYVSMGLYV